MNSLETFKREISSAWGPLTTETVGRVQELVTQLAKTPSSEPWVTALHQERPDNLELHRDPEHGYLLLAYIETQGRYRPPHDHGDGWVVYAVQHGEIEMGTYGRVEDPNGNVHLVQRELYRMKPGACQVYLPGDIHDTRAISESVLLFRFTSTDLKQEDATGRMTRYVEQGGHWTTRAA